MVAEVDVSCSFDDDGHRNAADWVQAVTNCSKDEAHARVRSGRMIGDLPAVGDAWIDGHIGQSQITGFTRLHSNRRVRSALPVVVDDLIEAAALLPDEDFRLCCQRVVQHADPDGAHADHETSRANRNVSLHPDVAGFRFAAAGDAMSGAVIADVLDAYAQLEFDAEWAAGTAVHGDRMHAQLLSRTNRQRRFDAFLAICRAAAEASSHDPLTPLVLIHCDEHTAAAAIRRIGHQTWTPPFGGDDTFDDQFSATTDAPGWPDDLLHRRCETASGAPVDPDDLLVALLIGRVQRVVHADDGCVIDLGRRQRLFTGAARQAALAGGDRCIVTGCHIRDGRIEIDHHLAWAATARHPGGGGTDQRNARVMCSHHNRIKDVLGIHAERGPDLPGGWHTYRVDGSRIGTRTSPRTTGPPVATGPPEATGPPVATGPPDG